jgi:tetratricopeptide (TPR) repeat protein
MYRKSLVLLLLMALAVPLLGATAKDQDDRSQAYYHFMLGLQKERDQDLSGAIDEYKQALVFDPKASDIFVRLADLYVQTNRVPEAIQDAQVAIQKDPKNKEAHRMLGQIYLEKMYGNETNRQDLDSAIEQFEAVHRIDPDDDSAMLSLGQLYLQANQVQKSADILAEYLNQNPDSQTAIMSIASAYQQLNQPEKAIAFLLKYAQLNPNNLYVLQQLADTYAKTGKFADALEYQKRAFEADSDNPSITRKYVDLLARNEKYEEAIAILEARVSNEPEKLEWLVLLAKTYQKWGKQEEAESLIRTKLAANPNDLDLQLALIQIFEEGTKYREALQQLDQMLQTVNSDALLDAKEQKTDLALIYSHMGYTAQQLKEYDQSTQYYEKAKTYIEPDEAGKIDFYIALNYRGLKQYDKSIDLLNDSIQRDPNDTDSWELLSLIYEEKGDQANSDKIIDHLISTHPNSLQYALMKAERMQRREKYQDAITYLKQIQPRFPPDDRTLFLLGSASERLKKYDDAEGFFRQVIALNPQNADAYNYLGYMLIDETNRVQEGLNFIKRALELDRNNGAYLDSLGWGYFKLNQLELAEDNLRQASQKLSDNAVVYDHLGDLYFKQGKFQLAVESWEKALEFKDNEIDPQFIRKKIDDTKNRIH